jgi:hypothetical protein
MLSYFLDTFLYLSFFSAIGMEAGIRLEIVREDIGCTGVTTYFIALWCSNLGGKAAGLCMCCKKGTVKTSLHATCLLA